MAGPVYHFERNLKSTRKLPESFDNAWFIFEWERGWIKTVHFDSEGRIAGIHPFMADTKFKRPISLDVGPDGALYLIEWGTAWYNNKDSQLVRLEYVP